jgi:hypothetical protein
MVKHQVVVSCLPMGAEVYVADVIMSNNTAGAFDIKLVSSSGQEFDLGTVENNR